MENKTLVRFEDFTYIFPEAKHQIVEYDNFSINQGDLDIVVGENGCGKSTLFDSFGYNPENQLFYDKCDHKGRICLDFDGFDGVDIYSKQCDDSKVSRRICYVRQKDEAEPNASGYCAIYKLALPAVTDALEYDREQRKQNKAELKKSIEHMFDKYLKPALRISFKEFKIKLFKKYSGGERKLISIVAGIIKAHVLKSKLILMDEPLNNLDANNKRLVNNMINEFRQVHPESAFLIISHCLIFGGVTKIIKFDPTGVENNIHVIVEKPSEPQMCLTSKQFGFEGCMYCPKEIK